MKIVETKIYLRFISWFIIVALFPLLSLFLAVYLYNPDLLLSAFAIVRDTILFAIFISLSLVLLLSLLATKILSQSITKPIQSSVLELSKVVDDSNHSYRARNSAIWALGQIGDNDALPILEKYYTGNIPPREPLNGGISQYELKKAINLVNGGINMTGFMWKYGDL